jgi:transposase
MPYIVINSEHDFTQCTIMDFNEGWSSEVIDCSTQEGKKRCKEISAPRASNRRKAVQSREPSRSQSQDVRYLSKELLNERDRRLFAGFLARSTGCGGIQKAARLTGLDEKTVRRGVRELKERGIKRGARIRREGGGRFNKAEEDPRFEPELLRLIEDEMGGDPMKEKKWVRKTLRWMRKRLETKGIKVSLGTIWNSLKKHGISLKKNKKSRSTQDHPKRDEQFQILNKLKRMFLNSGKPVISVDCKKKELIGNFKNDGKTWRKKAIEVLDHDFPNLGIGKLVPYGIYDLKNNEGHVYCGMSFETSEFAVDCICRWWGEYGQRAYPGQHKLLILCDSGGSNGYRRRAWKWDIQTKLADHFGLEVFVCHYPPGASKYNPIERKLFSFISKNWAGEPLTAFEKALSFIRSTTTESGLKVSATLVEKEYEKGIEVSEEQMKSLSIKRTKVCSQWNYCFKPR